MATFIVTIFKSTSLKPPQLTTTQEIPVIEPRLLIKFDLPIFFPSKQSKQSRKQSEPLQPKPGKFQSSFSLPTPGSSRSNLSTSDFQAYVKANDAAMRNMQTQGQNMQNHLTNITDMLSKIVTSNTAFTSGTLPSNTVTNLKEDLKGITTRSGIAYKGPTIPTTSSPKLVEREIEVIKDMMPPTN
ncbi:hypothetical protein Tco_0036955, partial [Tanacetum coccineum]